MEKIKSIQSTLVPLNINDIDTDQIIPARFLKETTRQGFGKNLFYDWRYDASNNPKADFILNNPKMNGNVLNLKMQRIIMKTTHKSFSEAKIEPSKWHCPG